MSTPSGAGPLTEPAPAASRPIPDPDELTDGYWESLRNHRLAIQRCAACGHWQHPPRLVCPVCDSLDVGYAAVSGRATLHSWTVIEEPPGPGFAGLVPLVVGVVELAEQPRLLLVTNIVGVDRSDLRLGMDLQVDYDSLDGYWVIPVFRPAEG